MTTVVSNGVWLEGHAAKEAGQPMTANPYPAGSQNSADWITGYAAAEEEQNLASSETTATGCYRAESRWTPANHTHGLRE